MRRRVGTYICEKGRKDTNTRCTTETEFRAIMIIVEKNMLRENCLDEIKTNIDLQFMNLYAYSLYAVLFHMEAGVFMVVKPDKFPI